MERWKTIKGWDHYQVSALGRVRSLPRKTRGGYRGGAVLKTWRHMSGYLCVALQHAPRRERVYVHVAVLEAFVRPRPGGLVCRHLDGNPANNKVDNLAWGTARENMLDMIEHGRSTKGERNSHAKITAADVVAIRLDGRTSKLIADDYGLAPCTVRQIKRRVRWSHIP